MMNVFPEYITQLLTRFAAGEPLTPSELEELVQWQQQSSFNAALVDALQDSSFIKRGLEVRLRAENAKANGWEIVQEFITRDIVKQQGRGGLYFMRRWHWAVAAILLFAIGSGIYYFNTQSNKSQQSTVQAITPDIQPGSNKAVLTINNNQNINLATNKTGININNTITYNDGEKIADPGQLLQLSTPRGGQYQAVLPDGSKVWLNAASSIKFPSTFNNKERRVEVAGEAYFEIAKDAKRPFKVYGANQEIEVLGTSFNINIYDDEPTKKTTLITGSIKITNNNQTAILQPGQQANIPILSNLLIRLIQVQTTEAIAWRNNLILFSNADLPSIMRQIARWYNIDIVYQSTPAPMQFAGGIDRNLPLSSVIKALSMNNIQCTIEGKKLIVQ